MRGEQAEQERFFLSEISVSIYGDSGNVSGNVKGSHRLMIYVEWEKNVGVKVGSFKLSLGDTIGEPDRSLGAGLRNRNDRVSREQLHQPLFDFCRDSIVVARGADDLPGLKVQRVQRKETTLEQLAEGAKDDRRKLAQTFGAVDAFQAPH